MTHHYQIEIEAGQEWFVSGGTVPVPAGTTPEQIRDQVAASLAAEADVTTAFTVIRWQLTPVRRNTR